MKESRGYPYTLPQLQGLLEQNRRKTTLDLLFYVLSAIRSYGKKPKDRKTTP